ncbi:MAG: UDP-N-acetylmuramate dehydrogenase [Chitinispirillaceae bacterium]
MSDTTILENVCLAGKTTYRIGGCARFYAEPETETDLLQLYSHATAQNTQVFVLGKGSNVLVSDRGWDGMVICLSKLCGVEFDGCRVEAQGGLRLDELVALAVKKGFAGMEELSGIPGTVGGAVVMNAGAFSSCISDTFKMARVLKTSQNTVSEIGSEQMRFGYRHSAVKENNDIVLSAVFEFRQADAEMLAELRRNILCRRKGKQPLNHPNCGSVFKRPPGNYAGTLIEMSGLKGFRIGDVEVSQKHANFIVNRGKGCAEDVRRVIRHVQKTVFERFDVLLEPEVLFVGTFDEPLYTPLMEL